MISKDAFNWNPIMEKNIDRSIKLAIDYDFKELHLSTDIEDFILHLSDNHSCDPKVLFFVMLSGIGHFGDLISVYNMETRQVKPISVYEVLIAPSGMY